MITRAHTVSFEGIDPRLIEVECALAPGIPSFSIAGIVCKPFFEFFVFYTLKCFHNPKLSSP